MIKVFIADLDIFPLILLSAIDIASGNHWSV